MQCPHLMFQPQQGGLGQQTFCATHTKNLGLCSEARCPQQAEAAVLSPYFLVPFDFTRSAVQNCHPSTQIPPLVPVPKWGHPKGKPHLSSIMHSQVHFQCRFCIKCTLKIHVICIKDLYIYSFTFLTRLHPFELHITVCVLPTMPRVRQR